VPAKTVTVLLSFW